MKLFFSFILLIVSLGLSAQVCIKGNCTNGFGKKTYTNGAVYEGSFVNGKREGVGMCTLPNGDVFRGMWKMDLPNGRGIMARKDGTKQEGTWEQGRYQQPVYANNQSKVVIKGDSTERAKNARDPLCKAGDCIEGKGLYHYENGDVYEGDFHNGLRSGKGVYRYKNGDVYEGDFQRHLFGGEGSITFRDGKRVSGLWASGAYLGKAKNEEAENPSPAPQTPTITEEAPPMRVWAVLVGVTKYKTMQELQYTDDDAKMLGEFLKSPEGGALPDEQLRILLNEEATFQNIVGAMAETFEKATANDLIVFYFSGHGLEGSFLPSDYEGQKNMLSHGIINSILLDSKAKYKLCLADACHSGSLLAYGRLTRSASPDQTVRKFYNSFKDVRGGLSLVMSSKTEEYSLEANGLKQGLFSHFLIKGMKGNADFDANKIVTISELFDYIQREVTEFSSGFQNPVMSGNFDPNMPVSVVADE